MKYWLFLLMLCLLLPSVSAVTDDRTDEYLSIFLENASGVESVVGDYSTSPHSFYVQPPAGETWILSRLLITVEDTGQMDSGTYGNGITLTNGITVRTNISGEILNLTNGDPIFTNVDWAKFNYDVNHQNFGLGNEFINVRWTFSKSGTSIKLEGDNNDKLEVIVNDDFSNLVDHKFLVQGYKKQTGGDSMALALIIGLGIIGGLILAMYNYLDEDHWLFKIFLMITMPLVLFMIGSISLNHSAGTAFAGTGTAIYTTSIWFMRVFYVYLGIAFIYQIFKSFEIKKKNGK